MKNYSYRVVFKTNLAENVVAGSVAQAIILAVAEQIKGGFKTDIDYVKSVDTGEVWKDVKLQVSYDTH